MKSCYRFQERIFSEKRRIYPLSRIEREEVQEFVKD